MKKLVCMMLLMGVLLSGCSDKVPVQDATPQNTTQDMDSAEVAPAPKAE